MKNKPWNKMLPTALALALQGGGSIGRLLKQSPTELLSVGGVMPQKHRATPSKYRPHQGAEECRRRRKQLRIGEYR